MMDEQEDRFDALLRDAARDYNAPPATPKAEMWERISAVRQTDRGAEGQAGSELRFQPRLRRPLRLVIGIAALLALGVAIGRLSVPHNPGAPVAPAASGTIAAVPGASRQERIEVAAQVATAQHLGQVETFLTEFDTRQAAQDFSAQAKDLLSNTRLLLDSKRLTDAGTRKLLEDLELVLIQIATLDPKDRREELGFIADGLAQSHLRSRLRNAIPADPTIRM
jgi:hypothetical protein